MHNQVLYDTLLNFFPIRLQLAQVPRFWQKGGKCVA